MVLSVSQGSQLLVSGGDIDSGVDIFLGFVRSSHVVEIHVYSRRFTRKGMVFQDFSSVVLCCSYYLVTDSRIGDPSVTEPLSRGHTVPSKGCFI